MKIPEEITTNFVHMSIETNKAFKRLTAIIINSQFHHRIILFKSNIIR